METVTDPNGEIYTYHQDTNGNLVQVDYPGGTNRQYLYEDVRHPNALTGVIDENGERFATWAYDDAGRVSSSEHAGGAGRVTLTYNADGTTTVTDAFNQARVYSFSTHFDALKIDEITGPACDGCGAASRSYDPATGFPVSESDYNGNTTTYVHNARGLEESRTEAAGTPDARTLSTVWHPTFRLPVEIAEPGRKTTLTYTSSGQLETRAVEDLVTGETRTWTNTYFTSYRGLLPVCQIPLTIPPHLRYMAAPFAPTLFVVVLLRTFPLLLFFLPHSILIMPDFSGCN